MKICTVCKTEQPLENFRKYSGRSREGLRPLCKVCQRAYEKTWRANSVEHRKVARQKRAPAEKIYRLKYNAAHKGEMLSQEAARRAARKGLPCDVLNHIPEIEARVQNAVCELTGLPLNLMRTKASWDSPSLDRIVPALGYTYQNLRIVCFAMNVALDSWGESQLQTIMSAWLARR